MPNVPANTAGAASPDIAAAADAAVMLCAIEAATAIATCAICIFFCISNAFFLTDSFFFSRAAIFDVLAADFPSLFCSAAISASIPAILAFEAAAVIDAITIYCSARSLQFIRGCCCFFLYLFR